MNLTTSLSGPPHTIPSLPVRDADSLAEILAKPSAKEAATLDKFRTEGGASAIREHCQHLTKEDCRNANGSRAACHKLHFQVSKPGGTAAGDLGVEGRILLDRRRS